MDQIFLDNNDAYVWLYDPTPWYYYIAGTAIVLGIIAVCLFPLWPMEMRQGVYYLSVAAAGFLVFIIVLAIIKYIIFVLLFIFTAGKLKFWIFPNLTEDVGFFESFMPVYVYTYDKPKKDKDSDDEESSDEEEEEDDKEDGGREGDGEGSETKTVMTKRVLTRRKKKMTKRTEVGRAMARGARLARMTKSTVTTTVKVVT